MSKKYLATVTILCRALANTGGIEKYSLRLSRAFAENGAQVRILTTGDLPELPHPDIKIISLCQTSKLSLLHLYRFQYLAKKYLDEHPSSIIFSMDRLPFQTHHRAGEGAHVVYLERRAQTESFLKRLSFSINPLHRYLLNTEKASYQSPKLKRLFVNSHMVRLQMIKHYAIPKERLSVVHNGVEWDEMKGAFEQSGSIRKQAKDKRYHFLFIGNGYQRKGLKHAFKAFALLPHKNWQLTVIGKEKNPNSFYKMAQHLNILDCVNFKGPQNSVILYYQQADVLIAPSLYDPFANVTIEALAMGLHVISSKYNGASEILTPENGTLIEDLNDSQALATQISHFLKIPKTPQRALKVRETVRHLDFSKQLQIIVTESMHHVS